MCWFDIQADPSLTYDYTSRGNLVGVITNRTTMLGLVDIIAGMPFGTLGAHNLIHIGTV
jgi:malic enzyme